MYQPDDTLAGSSTRTDRSGEISGETIRAALDAIPEPIEILSAVRDESGEIIDFRFDYANAAVCRTTGLPRSTRQGRRLIELFPHVPRELFATMAQVVAEGGQQRLEDLTYSGPAMDGDLAMSFGVSVSKFGDGVVLVTHDLTPVGDATSRLAHRASHDDLTGLLSRRPLFERLDQAVAEYRRYGGELSLILFDLDGFKAINDERGHQEGDRVLGAVGELISERARETDASARLGGDEFAILMPHTGPEDAEVAAHVICEAIAALGIEAGGEGVTASIGVASARAGLRAESDDLFTQADQAIYLAKASGGNGVRHWGAVGQEVKLFEL